MSNLSVLIEMVFESINQLITYCIEFNLRVCAVKIFLFDFFINSWILSQKILNLQPEKIINIIITLLFVINY